jgi:hypothetical protein
VTDSVSPTDDLLVPFGNVTHGVGSLAQTVTIANAGSAALSVSGIQITGADASQFSLDLGGGANPCGSAAPSIAAGGSCTVTVIFSPQSTGAKGAMIAIASNDPDEAAVNVALIGTGLSSITNNPPSAPVPVSPLNGQTGLGTSVECRWKKAQDPDNDPLTYSITYCADRTFAGCAPEQVSSSGAPKVIAAGFGWLGLFAIVTFVAGPVAGKRRRTARLLVLLTLMGALLLSCGRGGGGGGGPEPLPADQMSFTAAALNPGTTYYWKITVVDTKGGVTESAVWSYTTQ